MNGLSKEIDSILNEIAKSENFLNYEINYFDNEEKGNGFMSDITRVQIIGNKINSTNNTSSVKDQLSLVLKASFSNSLDRELFKSDTAFEREIFFYNEIAPAFLQFQREHGLTENDIFKAYPKCYKAIFDLQNELFLIILEDLKAKEFCLWPKRKVSKIENTKIVVRELAKLHAISFAMRDQCPKQFEKFEKIPDLFGVYFESGAFYNVHKEMFRRLINIFENPRHKQIYELLSENMRKFYDLSNDDSVPNNKRIICHGDCWNNNILYKFNAVSLNRHFRFD